LILPKRRGEVWKCLLPMRDCGAGRGGQSCARFRSGVPRERWWWM
jgi:hypothetical protein